MTMEGAYHRGQAHRTFARPVIQLRDVRVIERRQRLRFTCEARQPVRIGRKRLGQHLDRDLAIELRILGAIDLPMPPAPSEPRVSKVPSVVPGARAMGLRESRR